MSRDQFISTPIYTERVPVAHKSVTMPPNKTKTIKNKHAQRGSGIKNSKEASRSGPPDGIVRKSKDTPKGTKPLKGSKKSGLEALLKKRKKKVYTEKELDIPKLNTIVPAGVQKPKGKKKGKVFVDDRVRHLVAR